MLRSTLRILLPVLAVALLLPATYAQSNDNDGCSDRTIRGDYAFRVSGVIFVPDKSKTPPVPTTAIMAYRDGVAMTHFDGKGGLSQVDFLMGNGLTPTDTRQPTFTDSGDVDPETGFSTGEEGSYHVFPDCTGWARINFPPADVVVNGVPEKTNTGTVIKLKLVIARRGRLIHTIVSFLQPAGAPGPAFVNIHSDGERLGDADDRR